MSIRVHSALFMFVVLTLVLLGKEGDEAAGISPEDTVAATSLTADPKPAKSPELIPQRAAFPAFEPPLAEVGRFIGFAEPEKVGAISINPPPLIGAAAVSIYDINSSLNLLDRGSDKRWPIASITKLMTAVVVSETLSPNTRVVMTERAIASEGRAGGFAVGEVFSAEDLVKTMIMASSNDAAMALAGAVNYDEFIDKMRVKAFDLKMSATTFADPTGLSVLNQSKTDDLEKLARYIAEKDPNILEISARPTAEITEIKSGIKRLIVSTNRFAGERDFIGGKTGYTEESNGNLLSIFRHNGKKILIVIFGSKDRFGETEKLFGWVKKNF